jgi:hypothetical protein
VAHLLRPIWQRADLREPVFSAYDVAAWPSGAIGRLIELGILKATANAQTIACDSCGQDHLEEVIFIESPAGSGLRAYILCPEGGRVPVPLDRLRRWTIDFDGLTRATAMALELAGQVEQIVASRVWCLGKLLQGGRSREVYFIRGATWKDAAETIGRAPNLLAGAGLLLLVPGTVPQLDALPLRSPIVIPLSTLLTFAESGIVCDREHLASCCPDGVAGSTPDCRDASRFVFRQDAENWIVQFDREHGIFSPIDGLAYIAILLASPGHTFSAQDLKQQLALSDVRAMGSEELAGATVTKPTLQQAADSQTIQACKQRLADISSERDAARSSGTIDRLADLEHEEKQIKDYLSGAQNIRGRSRPLGDAQRSLFNAVKQAIERAVKKFKLGTSSLPRLHDHLSKSLDCRNGSFEYRPVQPAPPWEL